VNLFYPYTPNKNGVKRKPVYSLSELSEELGVPRNTLNSRLLRFEGEGKPVPRTRAPLAGKAKRHYYEKAEFITWWNTLPKKELLS
jgi:hypothetical protein